MNKSRILLIIGGPTASGKTSLAIRLARHFGTEILSCDSRQFFRKMDIGTAKPSQAELALAPHHFIDSLSIEEDYSVGDYERDALALLEELYKKHSLVIMAGGSGLYQKAVCEGLDAFPEVAPAVRQKVENWHQQEGIESLQEKLKRIDPDYYSIVDLQNPHRLIRALSVWEASGRPFSSFRKNKSLHRPFFPVYIELHWERSVLYERINQRVDHMMEQGLLEEARQLYPHKDLTALQTVGYQELFAYLDGRISLEEAVDLIKRNSRRYAKRQLTWTRRDGHWKHFSPEEWEKTLDYIQSAMAYQWKLEKQDLPENEWENPLFPEHRLLFSNEKENIAHCRVIERKYKIYQDFHLNKSYSGQKESFFFFHEIYHRMQDQDRVLAPEEGKLFLLEWGLINFDDEFLLKK